MKKQQKSLDNPTFNEARKLSQESIDLLPIHIPNNPKSTNDAHKQKPRQDCAFNRASVVSAAAILLRRIAVPILIILAPGVEI